MAVGLQLSPGWLHALRLRLTRCRASAKSISAAESPPAVAIASGQASSAAAATAAPCLTRGALDCHLGWAVVLGDAGR